MTYFQILQEKNYTQIHTPTYTHVERENDRANAGKCKHLTNLWKVFRNSLYYFANFNPQNMSE